MTCLVGLLLLAVITDLKSSKISNHLILIGIITGILFDVYEYERSGVSLWLPGILLPVILLFPLFLFKALGAGDIKLFSVIGSFYGAAYVVKSMAAAFLLGAVISLIYLIKYKILFYRFRHLFNYIQTSLSHFTNPNRMTQEKVTSNYKKAALENFLKKYLKKLKKPPEEDKKYFKSVHSRKHPEELFKELPKEYTIDIKFKSRRLPEPYYNKDRDGSQGVIHFSIAITGAILLQIIYSYL